MMSKKPTRASRDELLLTDAEAARLLNLSQSRFFALQKEAADFPAPLWLGLRCKRHVKSELLAWAFSKRERVVEDKDRN